MLEIKRDKIIEEFGVPITAIIVDDELNARLVLKELILKSEFNVEVIAECKTLNEAVTSIRENKPTVVFLDIQMPQYAGYEIINFFSSIDFEIIFVTAYDTFALRAFELNAMDYLVKPIERNRLSKALNKLESKISEKRQTEEYRLLLETLKSKKPTKLIIPEIGNRKIVAIDEIMAIEAQGAYTRFIMSKSESFVASKNLKHFENCIGSSHTDFFRSHRTFLVNLSYVKFLNKSELTLELTNKMKIKIARNRMEILEKMMK